MKRQGRKVRWRNLKTTDLETAKMKDFRYWQRQANKVIQATIKENGLDVADTVPTCVQAETPAKSGRDSHTLAETFGSWKRTWTCSQGTKDTRGYRWKMLARVLNPETTLDALTLPRLREIQAALQTDGLSATTVNDVIGKVLRLCLEHSVEKGWLPENPAAKLKPLKRAQTIRLQPSWDEAWKLVDEVCRVSHESGELLRFMLAFGVGQAEVKSLKGEHIDLGRSTISFVRQKTGKLFTVPVFPHAKPVLEALKTAGRIQTGKPVFAWRDPEQALHGACERLKMQVYTPRALRRSFIIRCLEQGIDARVVAKWQGHANAKLILSVYGAYVGKEHEAAQIAKLKGAV